VPSRLLVGEDRISANPKLNNCVKGWEAARHDWVILADSNVLMPTDYVAHLKAAWRDNTGLVCSTPVGSRPDGFWSELECAFLNTLQARWQYAGEALGLGFAQGKSMLWYRPFLEARGGIRALGVEIAEDAAATKLVRRAGLRVHLVDSPFEQPLGPRRPGDVWARQLRWARLRRVTFPLFFAPELLTGPAVPALCLGAATAALGGSATFAVGTLLAIWYGAEAALAWRMRWHLSWRMPAAFLVRDLLIPAMWFSAYLTQNVTWRGNVMHVTTKGGDADALAPSSSGA
jgi:ceramide glucosyltransferase